MSIRVLVADQFAIVRQGLRTLLEREGIKVLGEAVDGQQAVQLTKKLRPDVAVLDMAMPVLNGIDAAREIRRACPRTKPLLLSMHTEDNYVLESLHAGVRGYVMKNCSHQDLLHAIRQVGRGDIYLSPAISQLVVQAFMNNTGSDTDPLSARERQVLQLVAESNTTRQVAAQLGVSARTAESHRHRLMRKLQIHDTAGLVRYAIRRGLIQP